MHLIVGNDACVANWISRRVGGPICPPYTALGWGDGRLLGWRNLDDILEVGFVFYRYEPGGNIDFTVAASGRLTRGILATVADFVFNQAGCARLTSRPMKKNDRHCRLLEKAGFKPEGVQPHYYGRGKEDHAVCYRMLWKECRWLSSS